MPEAAPTDTALPKKIAAGVRDRRIKAALRTRKQLSCRYLLSQTDRLQICFFARQIIFHIYPTPVAVPRLQSEAWDGPFRCRC